jgi:hypothetical protein
MVWLSQTLWTIILVYDRYCIWFAVSVCCPYIYTQDTTFVFCQSNTVKYHLRLLYLLEHCITIKNICSRLFQPNDSHLWTTESTNPQSRTNWYFRFCKECLFWRTLVMTFSDCLYTVGLIPLNHSPLHFMLNKICLSYHTGFTWS